MLSSKVTVPTAVTVNSEPGPGSAGMGVWHLAQDIYRRGWTLGTLDQSDILNYKNVM